MRYKEPSEVVAVLFRKALTEIKEKEVQAHLDKPERVVGKPVDHVGACMEVELQGASDVFKIEPAGRMYLNIDKGRGRGISWTVTPLKYVKSGVLKVNVYLSGKQGVILQAKEEVKVGLTPEYWLDLLNSFLKWMNDNRTALAFVGGGGGILEIIRRFLRRRSGRQDPDGQY